MKNIQKLVIILTISFILCCEIRVIWLNYTSRELIRGGKRAMKCLNILSVGGGIESVREYLKKEFRPIGTSASDIVLGNKNESELRDRFLRTVTEADDKLVPIDNSKMAMHLSALGFLIVGSIAYFLIRRK